jgi:hypothetical protein
MDLRGQLSDLLDRGKGRAPDAASSLFRDKTTSTIQSDPKLKDYKLEDISIGELRARLLKSELTLDVSSWSKRRLIRNIDNRNHVFCSKRDYQDRPRRHLKLELMKRGERVEDTNDKETPVKALKFNDWQQEFT